MTWRVVTASLLLMASTASGQAVRHRVGEAITLTTEAIVLKVLPGGGLSESKLDPVRSAEATAVLVDLEFSNWTEGGRALGVYPFRNAETSSVVLTVGDKRIAPQALVVYGPHEQDSWERAKVVLVRNLGELPPGSGHGFVTSVLDPGTLIVAFLFELNADEAKLDRTLSLEFDLTSARNSVTYSFLSDLTE